MSLRPPQSERMRRLHGWLMSAALLALAPKCILCVLAYAGLGVAGGWGGPELCGATDHSAGLPVFLVTLGFTGFFVVRLINRSTPTRP
jgi:hypothetical protein